MFYLKTELKIVPDKEKKPKTQPSRSTPSQREESEKNTQPTATGPRRHKKYGGV
jgi:hypothetical protein